MFFIVPLGVVGPWQIVIIALVIVLLFGGKKIWLLASLPEQKILDDEVIPYVCFTNAHDGFGAIKACCCTVRVVCNNTLNLALSTAPRVWSCKHIGNLSSKIDEAKRALELAESYNKELAEFAMRAANTTITEEKQNQILSELFPVADDASDSLSITCWVFSQYSVVKYTWF